MGVSGEDFLFVGVITDFVKEGIVIESDGVEEHCPSFPRRRPLFIGGLGDSFVACVFCSSDVSQELIALGSGEMRWANDEQIRDVSE